MAKNKTDITFTPGLVHKAGKITDVLADFLDAQVARIQKEVNGLPGQAVQHLLAQFVTEEGTKKPVARASIEGALTEKQRDAILNHLEEARILRQDEPNVYELAHDTLAHRIADALDAEELEARRAAKYVRDRFQAFEETRIYLKPREVQLVEAHEKTLKQRLSEEEWAYLIRSREHNKRERRKGLAWLVGIIIALSALSLVALSFGISEETARKQAVDNLRRALNANSILEFEVKGDATRGFRFAEAALDQAQTDNSSLFGNDNTEPADTLEPKQTFYSIVFQDRSRSPKWFYRTIARHSAAVKWAAFSPVDSDLVISTSDITWSDTTQNCILSQTATGTHSPSPQSIAGHPGYIRWAGFSQDGSLIATVCHDHMVRIIDAATDSITTLSGHTQPVYKGAFSPDGGRLITAGEDTFAIIWDLAKKDTVRRLRGHSGRINWVGYYSNDKDTVILTASDDNTAMLYDQNGGCLDTLRHQAAVNWAAFSPEGQMLTASDDRTAILWDRNGDRVYTLQHAGPVNWAEFSRDGKAILTASDDNTAILWRKTKGGSRENWKPFSLNKHTGPVKFAAFSPDSLSILTASEDKTAILWQMAGDTAKVRGVLSGHKGAVCWAGFSPDGKTILTTSEDGTARTWSSAERAFRQFDGPDGPASSATLLPGGRNGGRILATYGSSVILLDPYCRPVKTLSQSQGQGGRVALSPDNSHFVTFYNDKQKGAAVLWNTAGDSIRHFRGHTWNINQAAFSPSGDTIITASDDRTIGLWNTRSGQAKPTFLGQEPGNQCKIETVQFSKDGRMVLALGREVIGNKEAGKKVLLWTLAEKSVLLPVFLKNYTASVNYTSFLPRRKASGRDTIITAADDQTIRLWGLNGECLDTLQGHAGPVNGVCFDTLDNTLRGFLSFSDDKTAIYWDSDKKVKFRLLGHAAPILAAEFSPPGPDGRKLILTRSQNSVIKLWTEEGELLATLREHLNPVNSAHFAMMKGPDSGGKTHLHILTASEDGAIRIIPVDREYIAANLSSELDSLTVRDKLKWGIRQEEEESWVEKGLRNLENLFNKPADR